MRTGSYHIIGAGNGIGRWFSVYLSGSGRKIYCYDISEDSLAGLPGGVVKCQINDEFPYSHYSDNFKKNDIFLLAIPQSVIDNLIENLFPFTRESLIVCLTSVQSEPLEKLNNCNIIIPPLGCHPLFGDTVSSPEGLIVILTGFNNEHDLHIKFRDDLKSMGFLPAYLTPEQHDKSMAVIQALPHYCFLLFAVCLSQLLEIDIFEFYTPNFQFLHAFACRFLNISPATTGAIQFSKEASNIRSKFVESAEKLNERLNKSGSLEETAGIISDQINNFPKKHFDKGLHTAAFAVDSIQKFDKILNKYLDSEKIFIFRDRISGSIKAVKILSIDSINITYNELSIIKDNKYAICLDEISRKNYETLGLYFGLPVKKSIKKSNIIIMEKDEIDNFMNNMILMIPLTMKLDNHYKLSKSFFENYLPMIINSVVSCKMLPGLEKSRDLSIINIEILHKPSVEKYTVINEIDNVLENMFK